MQNWTEPQGIPQSTGTANSLARAHLRPRFFMVVDDEPAIADLVEIHLLSEGYQVYKAASASEALKILEGVRG
jgi:PleD family two-component response regulator